MPVARASIIAAPGFITFQGQTVFFKEDLTAKPKLSFFDVKTAGHRTQKRLADQMYEISGIPNGVFAAVAAWVQAYASMLIGTDVFGPADSPLVIESSDGMTYTYSAAALIKPPDLILSAGKTMWGSLTFNTLGADNTAPTAANRMVAIAAAAYPNPDGYNPATIITQAYALSWGTGGGWAAWQNLDTEAGTTISFAPKFAPKKIDSAGTIGMRLTDMAVTAKAKPVGPASSDVLTALEVQGAGAGIGRSLAASGQPLIIVGNGVYAGLNAAALIDAGDTFSGEKNRVDDLTWEANETLVGGALQPLFYLGAAAPAGGVI